MDAIWFCLPASSYHEHVELIINRGEGSECVVMWVNIIVYTVHVSHFEVGCMDLHRLTLAMMHMEPFTFLSQVPHLFKIMHGILAKGYKI